MIKLLKPTHREVCKRKLAFLFFIPIATIFLFIGRVGQAQVVNFEGEVEGSQLYAKYFGVAATLNLGDKGFILAVGSEINKESYRIYCFDAEGKLKWKKTTSREYGIGGKKEAFICTPDNAYFYYIQAKEDRIYDKKTYVHQISFDGTEKKFEIEGKEEFGKSLQTIFCDKDFLYFAATENGDEYHKKKKVEDKLILTRFDHKTMASKSFPVSTPVITPGDETSFWSYIGSRDDIKFFTSKQVDKELNKNDFTVIGINASGEVKSNMKISTTLGEGKFIRPSYAVERNLNNAKEIVQVDYEMKRVSAAATGGGNASGTSGYRLNPLPTSFGQIVYDSNTDGFLVYGLYGPKPFKTLGPVYQGSYLYKYDLTGKSIWKTEQPAGDKLMDLGQFRVHNTPIDRDLILQTLPDKRILFTIGVYATRAPFLFSSDGKFVKSDFIEQMKKLDYQGVKIMALTENLKSINYIESNLKEQKGDLYTILNSKGEVLIFFPSKDKIFKNIFFKK